MSVQPSRLKLRHNRLQLLVVRAQAGCDLEQQLVFKISRSAEALNELVLVWLFAGRCHEKHELSGLVFGGVFVGFFHGGQLSGAGRPVGHLLCFDKGHALPTAHEGKQAAHEAD